MTVGIYINEPVPMMVSDCLALPKIKNSKIFSPSSIEFFDGKNGELAVLVSKFIFLDKKTIIALAGSSRDIYEFTSDFPGLWDKRDRNLSPMGFLHKIDRELIMVRPGWECSVVGASITSEKDSNGQILINNYASYNKNWKFKTENFGYCFSIGAGGDSLRKFMEEADKNISALERPITIYDLHLLVGGLNGHALYPQVKDPLSETWGGLLQVNTYDKNKEEWLRTPPWFHLCAFFKGKDFTIAGLHPKAVLHTSMNESTYGSIVLTWIQNKDATAREFRWVINSPFITKEERPGIEIGEEFDLPVFTTITTLMDIDGRHKKNHRTYQTKNVPGLFFNRTKGRRMEWHVDYEKFGKWIQSEIREDPEIRKLEP